MTEDRIVRTLASDEDVAAFLWCMRTGFLSGKQVTDEATAWAKERYDLSRTWAAFDEGELCGTARTFPSRVRLPGLRDAPVSCLTQVTVLPTHTRRGHLTRMMRAQLEAAIAAGEAASLLVAAEWPIYGRFGYGPASEWVEWKVDTDAARVVGPSFGRCRIVDGASAEKAAAAVLARHQLVNPGAIERPDWLNAYHLGNDEPPGSDKHDSRVRVVHEDDDGEPDAYAVYDAKERWDGMRPTGTLEVVDHCASSPDAERELWRYLVEVDLVAEATINGAPNSAARWFLQDGRAARQVGRWDHLWARLLDVPAALSARAYGSTDRLVLDVHDGFLGRGGRFVLDGSPERAACAPTSEEPDVSVPIAALGAAWFGGTDLRALAASGTIVAHTPGAVERLGVLFSWHQVPDCATDF